MAPLDLDGIAETIAKTSRALIVHEDNRTAGVGAEVAALIAEECFDLLDAPVARVAGADTHIPFDHTLESAVLPNAQDVLAAARALLAY